MAEFETGSSGVGAGDHSAKCATTAAQILAESYQRKPVPLNVILIT